MTGRKYFLSLISSLLPLLSLHSLTVMSFMYSYFLTIPKPSSSCKHTVKAENEKSIPWDNYMPYEGESIFAIWENVTAVHKCIKIATKNKKETFCSGTLPVWIVSKWEYYVHWECTKRHIIKIHSIIISLTQLNELDGRPRSYSCLCLVLLLY